MMDDPDTLRREYYERLRRDDRTALATLRAERNRLAADVEQLTRERDERAQRQAEAEAKVFALLAEVERVTRERDEARDGAKAAWKEVVAAVSADQLAAEARAEKAERERDEARTNRRKMEVERPDALRRCRICAEWRDPNATGICDATDTPSCAADSCEGWRPASPATEGTPEFCGLGPAPVAWNPPVVGTITGGSTPHAWNPPVVGTTTTASSLTSLALPASSAGTDATCPECRGRGHHALTFDHEFDHDVQCTACHSTGRAPTKGSP